MVFTEQFEGHPALCTRLVRDISILREWNALRRSRNIQRRTQGRGEVFHSLQSSTPLPEQLNLHEIGLAERFDLASIFLMPIGGPCRIGNGWPIPATLASCRYH
jgi:hypothetical protein